MILNINEIITKETVDKISKSLSDLKVGEKLFIYFSSEGGEISSGEAIIHIINNNVDLVEVVGYGDLMSQAFDVFFKIKCYKILLPNTIGMCHSASTQIDINENAAPYSVRDSANKKWMKLQKEQTLKFCNSLGMNQKEITDIRKGKDVYFQYDRMKDFLKTQNTD